MKKLLLNLLVFLISFSCFSQDTQPPTTPTNFQFISNPLVQPDSVSAEWQHGTDNVGIATYEIYINGILEEIIAYDASSSTQYVPLLYYPNGTYCLTILARDAAGNASPLSNQICKSVNVIYQNPPTNPYLSGFLNYTADNKAIEISNQTIRNFDLANYTLKISYDGNATWDAVYTFPANTILVSGESYVIAHPNISICTTEVDDYNSAITNFDGNDVIGLFKFDNFYDSIGELGNSTTLINTDLFIKRETLSSPTPSTTFDLGGWNTYVNNGNCPDLLGFSFLVVLDVEDEALNSFQIYPNPIVTNTLQFNTKNNQTIDSISIVDINGRTVLNSSNIINNQIDIQTIKKGVYFVKIQSKNKISTHKLIRQ
ncbi:T9SS type A sorting domain-containing protein [Kordia sp. YSTF-M3]|uniref:T9SS type A sorting domain-containing protein n=1 Tax=Kordia aestuariivivens TaxID=2759037 RepID=A0ABR7Q7H6_9FLAO|nr:T9SS type A sorting domain-containing protein [Kordia aestuariivivens]MBC8754527.1 T9SS type A sorting domain-containing protein [Kordia aestuariivivens]